MQGHERGRTSDERCLLRNSYREPARTHTHYLKSTVFCARCEERLIIQVTTNRHGTTYSYFICSGRHEKRNGWDLPAIPMRAVEELIEDEYYLRRLSAADLERVSSAIVRELSKDSESQRKETVLLQKEKARLDSRSRKLLDAHLDGAVPAELYRAISHDA